MANTAEEAVPSRGAESVVAAADDAVARRHHTAALATGVGFFGVLMILPLFLVKYLVAFRAADAGDAVGVAGGVGAATAGAGALFRSVSRNLLRTTVGVTSRTVARTVSRHWTEQIVHWAETALGRQHTTRADKETPHPVLSVVVGAVAVGISYVGVLLLAEEPVRTQVLGAGGLWFAGFAAMLPMVCYFIFAFSGGRIFKVQVIPRTEVDGLLLQLYFTMAVSFLPLTSDGEYRGSKAGKAHAAFFALGLLFMMHLLFHGVFALTGMAEMQHLASMFLVYTFVLALPMHPLDGAEIWDHNKWLWAAFFGAVIVAFNVNIPGVFYELL